MGHTRATRSGVCCHGKTGRGTGDGQCRQAAIRPGCQGGVRGDDAILAQLCERRHNYQTWVSWSIASAALDAGREPRTGPASESIDATPSGLTTTHSPTTIRGPRQPHRGRPQAGSARVGAKPKIGPPASSGVVGSDLPARFPSGASRPDEFHPGRPVAVAVSGGHVNGQKKAVKLK